MNARSHLSLSLLRRPPATFIFGALAACVAIFADWSDGMAIVPLFGVAAGVRRWTQRRTLTAAGAYVMIGVAMNFLRTQIAPDPFHLAFPAMNAALLAFIGHRIGSAARLALDIAAHAGAAPDALARPAILDALKRRGAQSVPNVSRGAGANEARGETLRPGSPVTLPKGWTPTVRAPRRGLFG